MTLLPSAFVYAIFLLFLTLFFVTQGVFSEGLTRRTRLVWLAFGALSAAVFCGLLSHRGELVKTIGTLLMPAGLLWLLVAVAIGALIARHQKRAALWTAAAWGLYSLAGSPVVGQALANTLERPYVHADHFSTTYDAVVVLGGGTATHGDYEYLGFSGDRVMLGARLWHTGRTGLLVTTGSTPPNARQSHVSADVTARLWHDLGIPDEAILRVSSATDTTQELEAIGDLARRHGWRHIGLVTSARHMQRALANAERFQVRVTPLPADFSSAGGGTGMLPFIPQGRGFFLVHTTCWEYLGALARQ